MSSTGVEDLSPIASLPHLRTLSIRQTKVRSLAPLASSKTLVTLNLSGLAGVDLLPLAKIPTLKSLTVKAGQIPDAQLAAFQQAAPRVKVNVSKY